MPGMFDQGRVRFRLGHGWMAPYVHEAARGMAARESKALTVGPDEAYGPCKWLLLYTSFACPACVLVGNE